MDNIVDKVFIINLDKRIDRMNNMIKLMEKLEITNWQRFPAIRPKHFNDINPYLYSGYNHFHKLNKKYIKGSIGCKFSHLEILKIAKKNKFKKILILEDDVEFIGNLQYIFLGLQEADNNFQWDMIFLGMNKPQYKNISDLVFLNHLNSGLCTHSYIVHQRAYSKLIELLENSNKQIDIEYNNNFKNLTVYIIPKQFKQNQSYSDINNIFNFNID